MDEGCMRMKTWKTMRMRMWEEDIGIDPSADLLIKIGVGLSSRTVSIVLVGVVVIGARPS